jgi:hypothetical protein
VDLPGAGNETTIDMNQSREILMQVRLPNMAPNMLMPVPDLSFPEDTDAIGLYNVSGHFSDEGPVTWSISYEEDPSTLHGTMDGPLLNFLTPAENWNGRRQFRVRATDDEGLSTDSNTFTVEVTPVDDPPFLAPAGPFVVMAGAMFSGKLVAGDVDDPVDSLRFTSHTGPLPQIQFRLDPVTGEFSILSENAGSYQLVFSVMDPQGMSSARMTVMITILRRNSPPVFTTNPPATVYVCQTYIYQVGFSDPDGDATILALASGPPGLWLDGRTVTWTPRWTFTGNASVSLRLEDGKNPPVFQDFEIRVLPVNRPPVAEILNPSDGAVFISGAAISFRGRGMDPDGDNLSYSWTIDGRSAGNGTELARTLQAGTHSISFSVFDGKLAARHNITVKVTGDRPPVAPPKGATLTLDGNGWLCGAIIAAVAILGAAMDARNRLR